ncbi:MAG: helix-turn-helix transcriptional regulator [Christensenellaceae bacterium]|nr:helix-turn-helix transcriptional regulator [Christensenellaceae bacterium]
MKDDYGITFKNIRQKKGFKAKEVAEGIVSVQFLRRFEKGDADIRLSNFCELLKKINMSFEEFMYIYNEETLDRALDDFDAALDKVVLNGDNILLLNMMENFEQSYKKTGEIRYLHFSIICKIYYNRDFNANFKIDKEAILSYFDRCETWTEYEYFIANHVCQIFDMNYLYTLTLMALDNKTGNRKINNFTLDFCFHATSALVNNDRDDYAKNIIDHYYNNKKIKKDLPHLSFNVAMRFLEGILMVKKGEAEGHKICNDIINFYNNTIDYKGYANNINKYYVKVASK